MSETVYVKISRVNIRNITTKITNKFNNIPLAGKIAGGVFVLAVISYGLIFIPTKDISFSYGGDNCFGHFLLAPDSHQPSSGEFKFTAEDKTKIGDFALFSTKLCVEPNEPPEAGDNLVANAPFGGPIGAKQFNIKVPEPPKPIEGDIVGKEISTARPLEVRLTEDDEVHDYYIKIDDKSSECDHSDSKLLCDVKELGLKQGKDYLAAIYREFKDKKTEKLIEGELTTLKPVKQKKASITHKKVIYNKPKEFTFSFDQPLVSAEFSLHRVLEGGKADDVEASYKVDGETLKITLAEHLPREESFRLTIDQVIAENGASLDKPIKINFYTSGGPKVKSVSVGLSGVPHGSRVVLTFDQAVHDEVDIAKFIRTSGVSSVVSRLSKTQVALSLQNTKECASFKITVDKGIKSGTNDTISKEGWSYSSRIVCGYSWQIGTSVQGRPIIAYSFGSGSKVILFTAGIHGSEPSSTSTMQAWVNYLQSNAGIIPKDKRVVIVPNTNPDGIAVGLRNNANNVNLGRNFPTANWKADIDTASGILKNGGGKKAGSEPETKALINLTRQLRPRVQISFHAQGSLVGANKYADSVRIGDIYASTVGYATMYYNAEQVMGYSMTGEYEDWMGEEMGIPAILIELPTRSGNYINSQLPALRKMLSA